MKKKHSLIIAAILLAFFVLWTFAVTRVDVHPIGPERSSVGFASINGPFHERTGVHLALYDLTDLLSIVPLGFVMGFALQGLVQWFRRKHLFRVDRSILLLGGFYVVVLAVFILFEFLSVNYRPVLIEGKLEASYPSSTTMLVLCVMPTAILQMNRSLKPGWFRRCLSLSLTAFTVFMVVGRMLSGVHWLTDIIGGVLLSAGLVLLYTSLSTSKD